MSGLLANERELSDEERKQLGKARLRHGRIIRATKQVADSADEIGLPYRALTLLDEWERAGRITPEMHQAGDEFHRLFRIACHDPLQAADMGRVGGCQAHGRHSGSVVAQNEVHSALRALGGISGPLGSAAWSIIGFESSIRDWAARGVWNGRPIDQKVAAGILIGALDGLRKHFGK